MIPISKLQRQQLEDVGLLQYRRNLYIQQDQNFVVVNRQHKSRDKSYYVVESPDVLAFLGYYDSLNLQKLRHDQIKTLKQNGMLTDKNMQKWGTYVPNALAFEDSTGHWRIKKKTDMMIAVGIWKQNKKAEEYHGTFDTAEEPTSMSEVM